MPIPLFAGAAKGKMSKKEMQAFMKAKLQKTKLTTEMKT